jgi:hypothetical protein
MGHHGKPRRRKSDGELALHERDPYTWSLQQAALLRAGRLAEADVRNIAEEIDAVGREQYNAPTSALRLILLHLLKWDYQPARRSRSWVGTILVQRLMSDVSSTRTRA